MRTLRHIAALAASGLVSVGALCGCGSGTTGNGVASKSPDAIVAAASEAVRGVKTVHVAGSTASGGTPVKLNLRVVSGKGGSGEISQNGLAFRIVAIDQSVYISGSDSFWRHFGGAAAVQLFHGKWLKAPATGELGAFASLTNVPQLFNKLLSNHGTLEKGETTTVDGQKAIAVNDTTEGGTLYVATIGKPYPLEVVKSGAEGGRLTFDQYNQPVSLAAPANSIDLSELH